jgi:adenylyltransferase/sulfurtransferase
MNDYFARQKLLLRPEVGKMILCVRLLVVGAGAGGNELLKNLVLMGFRNITIVDFDYVEDSNLSRTVLFRKEDIGKSKAKVAAERLNQMALAEDPHIVGLHGNLMTDFGKGNLFMNHDIVISCVDTKKCRAFISDWCVRTNTPFFEMGFEGYTTNVTFFAPEDSYEQISDGKFVDKLPTSDGFFPKIKNRLTVCLREEFGQGDFDNKRNSCSGFKMADTSLEKIPTIQSAAAMAGTLIVTELVKYLSGKDTLRNKILYYYGLTHETICCSYKPSSKCTIHQEQIPIHTLEVSKQDTIGTILTKISKQFGAFPLLQVPFFVFSGHCASCGKKMTINKLEAEMFDDERWCADCRSQFEDYHIHLEFPNQWDQTPTEISLNSDESILQMRFCDIGVPYDDILKVTLINEENFSIIYLRLYS